MTHANAGPDPISRLNAALKDRYAIEGEIGQGGMATVYLAEDLRHERKVALKVLKPELAAVVGAERFLAEIKTTANLQHPHILPLFDSGEADGFLFYVMPYIEGESLRDRLDRDRQLPVAEAVRLASAIAGALDHAHRHGVIHRDIKPANILVQDGQPVVADFGIALAVGAASGARLTETGLSVGTPYYMSPEQATGDQSVGQASDTYALACVLYEMLVGEPPFPGATAQAVLGKIIAGEAVSATKLRPAIPPNVDAALRRALEKLPADRFSSAQEFAKALEDPAFSYGVVPGAGATVASGALAWKVATLVFALTTAALVWSARGREPEASAGVLRYELQLPVEVGAGSDFGSNIAISPDGRTIAYSGMAEDSEYPGLWIRERDSLEPVELAGTALAVHPTFSPDGSRVAFIGNSRTLEVASLEGRPPIPLHEGPGLRRAGLSWGDDGYIYFADGDAPGGPFTLHRIPEDGGEIERVTVADTSRLEVGHYFPDVLPGSELVLFSVARETQYDAATRDIAVANTESGEIRVLLQGVQAVWSTTGHILAIREDGVLVAATFDPTTLEVGPATPVFEGVQLETRASVDLAISDQGTLVYAPGERLDEAARRLVWVDRLGRRTSMEPTWDGQPFDPRLSPDGNELSVTLVEGPQTNVWVRDLVAGTQAKLTAHGPANFRPVWLPDGGEVAFVTNRAGELDIYSRRADAAIAAEVMIDVAGVVQEVEFSRDGAWMVAGVGEDLHLQATTPGSELVPLIAVPGVIESSPAVSPDGRWISYTSDESGQFMVYVRPFPNVEDGKFTVSREPARAPAWAPDGTELFYTTFDGRFMAVEVVPGTNFIMGERGQLFATAGLFTNNPHRQYDVHPDGDRFLMIELSDARFESTLVVVENFGEELAGQGRD